MYRSLACGFVLLLAVTSAFAQIRGSGEVIKQDRDVGSFRGTSFRSGIDVFIDQGSKPGLVIEADDFRVMNAKLKLTGGSDARIHVMEDLKVDASGGSQIYVSGDPHIDANLSGGSKVHR